jgi:hypothetical protein
VDDSGAEPPGRVTSGGRVVDVLDGAVVVVVALVGGGEHPSALGHGSVVGGNVGTGGT